MPVPFLRLKLTVTLDGGVPVECRHADGELWDGQEARERLQALNSG